MRPDLSPEKVRETAELMRLTARQALEELRGVIGVLREEPGQESVPPAAPQPRLSDIRRLVAETRLAGARIEFEMRVDDSDPVPGALGRDAYRIVPEALTNAGKHASGSTAWVRITGGPDGGLHVRVRNRKSLRASADPVLPGAGAGLLGLQERVALAGGTLVHGPDESGDFVVDAELHWQSYESFARMGSCSPSSTWPTECRSRSSSTTPDSHDANRTNDRSRSHETMQRCEHRRPDAAVAPGADVPASYHRV